MLFQFHLFISGVAALALPQIGPITPSQGQPLNDMPILGMGMFGVPKQNTTAVMIEAMKLGYRYFDTAAIYGNEREVGVGLAAALAETGLRREDVWVTTKLWNDKHHDVEGAMKESLQKLNLSYVDLYLMHYPIGERDKKYTLDHVETWKQMESLIRPSGPTRFIGISNFNTSQLNDLLATATIKPKTHQYEMHPYLQQTDFTAYHRSIGIPVTAYASMGNTSPFYDRAKPLNPTKPPILTANPILAEIGAQYGCSAAQVGLAWNMGQEGVAVLAKAARVEHQKENIEAREKCKLTEEDGRKIGEMQKRWSARVNNPCLVWPVKCFGGLMNEEQGTYPLLLG